MLGLGHGGLVALFDQVGDLLAHLAVGLLRLGCLAARLFGREARLELGLHVARELALGHDGRIGVGFEGEGRVIGGVGLVFRMEVLSSSRKDGGVWGFG